MLDKNVQHDNTYAVAREKNAKEKQNNNNIIGILRLKPLVTQHYRIKRGGGRSRQNSNEFLYKTHK